MILYRTTLDQLLVWLKDSNIGDHAPSIDVLAGGSHLRKRPVLLWSVQFWLEPFRLALKSSKRPKRIEMPNVQKLLHFQGFRKLYYKVARSHLPAPQILRVLKLYYKVASSHLPAPQILRVLKLYYKVASSQLPAPQIAPRTKVVLESRQFASSSSPDTPRTKVVLQSRQFSASSSTDCSAY